MKVGETQRKKFALGACLNSAVVLSYHKKTKKQTYEYSTCEYQSLSVGCV